MSQNLDGFAAFDGPPANAVDDNVVSQDHSSAIGSDQHRVDKFGRAMALQGSPGSASLPNPRPMQASDLSGLRKQRAGGTQRDVVATHFPSRSSRSTKTA